MSGILQSRKQETLWERGHSLDLGLAWNALNSHQTFYSNLKVFFGIILMKEEPKSAHCLIENCGSRRNHYY